jgi:signal transduction histidine kinase
MRTTIIQRTRTEQSALQANSELITALSHDIRNPLTALIGYLELLDMDRDALSDTDREYVRAGLDKSYRIRDLTNEMFRYFLVFGRDQTEPKQFESYNAQMLLWQLLGECSEYLIAQGFRLKTTQLQTPCTVCTDVGLFKRVVDNLVSNAEKYADRGHEILISAEVQADWLVIRMRNTIAATRPGTESNHIGLRACETIMQQLHGEFTVRSENGEFAAECRLPIEK